MNSHVARPRSCSVPPRRAPARTREVESAMKSIALPFVGVIAPVLVLCGVGGYAGAAYSPAQSTFSGVTCASCTMTNTTMTTGATLDGSAVATSASVATAIGAISFPVTSVNGGGGAISGLETSSHASSTYLTQADAASTYLTQANAASTYLTSATAASTYATIAQATYTAGTGISIASNVISSTAPVIRTGTTGSIGGGLLAAGGCTSGTVSVTGATTGMVAVASPVTYPGDGVQWQSYVSSANTVTVKVCGVILVTPGSTAYNVRVVA